MKLINPKRIRAILSFSQFTKSSSMQATISRCRPGTVIKRYPIIRGMLTYAILWPSSNITQQVFHQQRPSVDLKEARRFCIFGAFFIAPNVALWIKIGSKIIPGQTFTAALKKVLVEQVLFFPYMISSFYVGMSWLEGKTYDQTLEEVREKFLPTYKTGLMAWPLMQTFNYAFIKEKNRVVVTGLTSFIWTIFLSHMKRLEVPPSNT